MLHLKRTFTLMNSTISLLQALQQGLCVCKCKRSFNRFRILSFFPKWKLFLIHLSLETSWLVIMENREKRGFTIKPKFVVFEKKLSFLGEFSLFRTCETRLVVSFNFAENVLTISSGISCRIKEMNSVQVYRYIGVSYYTRLHSKKAIWCNLNITMIANNLMAKKYIVCFNIISNVFIFFIGRRGEKSDILWQKDKPNKLPIFSSNAQTKIVIFFPWNKNWF